MMTLDNWKHKQHYWDLTAGQKEFKSEFSPALFKKYVPLSAHVLDFGCGYGRILGELSAIGYTHLNGIDISINMLTKAKRDYPAVNFYHNDSFNLPFADGQLDSIILTHVLTCIPSSVEQSTLLVELKRILKPQGVIYVTDFLISCTARNIERYDTFHTREQYPYGTFCLDDNIILRHHKESDILAMFGCFDTLVYRKKTIVTMNNHQTQGFIYMGIKHN